MAALRVLASEAPELVYLATMVARYTNAACHWDLAGMPEAERAAEVERLIAWFEEMSH
jgi:hypothetical protein